MIEAPKVSGPKKVLAFRLCAFTSYHHGTGILVSSESARGLAFNVLLSASDLQNNEASNDVKGLKDSSLIRSLSGSIEFWVV